MRESVILAVFWLSYVSKLQKVNGNKIPFASEELKERYELKAKPVFLT